MYIYIYIYVFMRIRDVRFLIGPFWLKLKRSISDCGKCVDFPLLCSLRKWADYWSTYLACSWTNIQQLNPTYVVDYSHCGG